MESEVAADSQGGLNLSPEEINLTYLCRGDVQVRANGTGITSNVFLNLKTAKKT